MTEDQLTPVITEVREAHCFDETALNGYLSKNMSGYEGSLKVWQFEGGQSNPTFLLESGESRYVLRKKPPGELLPKAHAVEREFKVMDALRESEVPVPDVRVLCQDENIIGTPFYVMEHVEGRVSREASLPEMSPSERGSIYDSMNDILAKLHRTDFASVGLGKFGKAGEYIPRQVALWIKQYRAAQTEVIPAMEALVEFLPRRIPSEDLTAIAHGDYRLENTVLHPSEPRIVAILDWELCTLGHPLADLAYNSMPYRLPEGEENSFGGLDLELLGIPTEEDYVRSYASRAGRGEIVDWPFYQVFAQFRLAAICQGVYKRGLQGNASSDHALERGAKAKMLAETGWQIAQEKMDA